MGLGLAMVAASALLPFLGGVDLAAEAALQAWRTSHGIAAFRMVSLIARPLGVVLLGLAVAFVAWRRRPSLAALETLVATAAGTILIEGLKHLIARPRPNAESLWMPGRSFPSGHVGNVLLFGVCAVCLLAQSRRRGAPPRGLALVIVAVALVGASRLYLGRHWLSDMLVTAALFGGYAVLAFVHPDRRVRRGTIAVAATAAGLALGVGAAGRQLALPTGMTRAMVPTASIDFGTALADGRLGGTWAPAPWETVRSAAVLTAPAATIDLGVVDPRTRAIHLVGRPLGNPRVPRRLRLALNGTELGVSLLHGGWRPYVFAVPVAAWRDGGTRLTLEVQPEAAGASLPAGPLAMFSAVELLAPRKP